jgi:hypothetical protein
MKQPKKPNKKKDIQQLNSQQKKEEVLERKLRQSVKQKKGDKWGYW